MPTPAPSSVRVVGFAAITIFLDLVGFGLVLPLMPFYVESMHGSAEAVGWLLSLFATAQLAATPFMAGLSDRVGRRPVILVSLAGNAAAMILFAAATKVHLLALLFVSRILAGATSGNIAACQAAVSDVTDGDARTKAMGRVGAAIGLGLILGPVIGASLARLAAWAPPLVAGAVACVDLVLAFFLMPETRHLRGATGPKTARPSLWRVLSERKVFFVLALFFLNFTCLSLMQVALALMLKARLGWGERETGMIFGLIGLVGFVVQGFFIGRLTRRFGPDHLVIGGMVMLCGGMALLSAASQAVPVDLSVLLIAGGTAVCTPVLSSLAAEAAGSERAGAILGIAQSSGGLARVICPVIGGLLFTRIAPGAPFAAGAVAAVVAVGVALRLKYERVDVA